MGTRIADTPRAPPRLTNQVKNSRHLDCLMPGRNALAYGPGKGRPQPRVLLLLVVTKVTSFSNTLSLSLIRPF